MDENYTVLIVDDDGMTLDVLEGYLFAEGYNLLLAKNGFRALEYMESQPVDLVILDVMMPHMNGFEVCQRIKEKWSHVQVVLITAIWDDEERQAGQAAGADGFLKKPIGKDKLTNLVQYMLSIGDAPA